MNNVDLELRPLQVADADSFKRAVNEFAVKEPDFSFAFNFNPNGSFVEYVQLLENWTKGVNLPDNFVPNTFLVAVVDSDIVGRVSIRHELNDFLAKVGGHIGYGVIPSRRRKGYGNLMLKLSLPIASALGISNILITCDDNNLGSRKIIENNGGVFEGLYQDAQMDVAKRRYWIDAEHTM